MATKPYLNVKKTAAGHTLTAHGALRVDWSPDIYVDRDVLYLDLAHVRAANGIEIEYSSERDGWVIYRTTTVAYKETESGRNMEQVEVRREKAFIPAWDDDQWEME